MIGRGAAASLLFFGLLAPWAETQEPTVPDRYAPGEEAHWVIEKGDTRLGYCWSRYDGEVELANVRAQRFSARARVTADVPGGKLDRRYTTELWTDAAGHPLRLEFRAAVSDVYASVEAVFADGKASATVCQGRSEQSLDLEVPADSFVLANNFVCHLELMLALQPPGPGAGTTYTMFSPNVMRTIPLVVEYVEDYEDEDGGGSVQKDSLGEVMRFSDDGRLMVLDVPAQGIAFRRVEEPAEAFTIEPPRRAEPPDFDREEVTIAYDDVSLAGTITRPKGAKGRLPAVFFVSGSGGQDRDGFSNGIDVGTHEILDRLTSGGFLVLRVDDRGTGASTGPTEGMTFDDLVEDARRCVLFLHAREDVDPERIAVIGHSEGGETAPILAARMDEIAAIVLMAAPGREVLELAREQLLHGKRLEGAGEEELAAFAAKIDDFYRRVLNDEPVDPASLPAELRAFVGAREWMKSHAKEDPLANIARVRCPVLLLQGARDIQVSAERDAARLLAALDEAKNPDHTLVVFPELDHLFKKTIGEESSGLDYMRDRPVDPAFLDTLVAWLKARLAP